MGTVKIIHPEMPDEYEFEIPGLGLCLNNVVKDVDEAQISAYKSNGYEWPESGNLIIDYTVSVEAPVVEEPVVEPIEEPVVGALETPAFTFDSEGTN